MVVVNNIFKKQKNTNDKHTSKTIKNNLYRKNFVKIAQLDLIKKNKIKNKHKQKLAIKVA